MSQSGEGYAHDTEVSPGVSAGTAAPAHVALILVPEAPDPRAASQPRHGPRTLCDAILELQALGVKQLTLSAFGELSSWASGAEPSEARRFADFLTYATPCLVAAGIRVKALGDVDELPTSVRQGLERLLCATHSARGMSLTLLVSYAGRSDIVETARHLAALVHAGLLIPEEIDEALFRARMLASALPDFDLCIRSHDAPSAHDAFPFQVGSAELLDIAPEASELGAELSRVFESASRSSAEAPAPSNSRLRKRADHAVRVSSTGRGR